MADTLAAVLKEQPDWSRVPAQAQRLLRLCLEKDPRKRLQWIADWRLVLNEGEPETRPRMRFLGWGVAAAMTAVAFTLYWATWRTEPPAPSVFRYRFHRRRKTGASRNLRYRRMGDI